MTTRSRSRGRGTRFSTPTQSLPGSAVRDGGEPQLRSGLRRTAEAGEGMTEKQFENAEGDAENRQQERVGLTKAGTVSAIWFLIGCFTCTQCRRAYLSIAGGYSLTKELNKPDTPLYAIVGFLWMLCSRETSLLALSSSLYAYSIRSYAKNKFYCRKSLRAR